MKINSVHDSTARSVTNFEAVYLKHRFNPDRRR
jgi:hypothetical protein